MKRRNAFTLTELLVVIPVIALVGTLLLASLGDSKQTVQAAACLNNMRQWGLALGLYSNDYQDLMPYEGDSQGAEIDQSFNLTAWYNVLPPYMNQTPLKNLYAANQVPLPGSRSIFTCPSSPNITYSPNMANPYFSYAMDRLETGQSGSLYPRSKAALPGQVIFLSESENNSYSFTDGYYLGTNAFPSVPPRHLGGMNFVFVDGHAQWFSQKDYSRTSVEASDPAVEWQKPRALYWYPCKTCSK